MNPLALFKKIAHKVKSLITGENLSDYHLNNNQFQPNKNKAKKEGIGQRRNRWGFPKRLG
tara:strand:- start:1785 stop:1964 length:180 start_codon:yes stop_codon:yes gene_type:complete